ncbi:hypothetical protein C8J56DRAFT_895043 [Mycena floridula]|nr:hypothetical protein C8J56DRAFT_895043 [Mycena floridula]
MALVTLCRRLAELDGGTDRLVEYGPPVVLWVDQWRLRFWRLRWLCLLSLFGGIGVRRYHLRRPSTLLPRLSLPSSCCIDSFDKWCGDGGTGPFSSPTGIAYQPYHDATPQTPKYDERPVILGPSHQDSKELGR